MDFRITGAGSNRNPFQQVNRYQQQNPFQLPVTWGENTSSAGGTGYTPYLDRSKIDEQLRERRNQRSGEKPLELSQMRERIATRQTEIDGIQKQLRNTNDPELKRYLESNMNIKNAGFASLQGEYNKYFTGITSGFVGNEGKIDHIGSFVTTV